MFPANSKTATEYQRLADVPISVFEICMAQTNKTGVRFSKVPVINGPGKLSPFTLKIEVSIVLHPT